ncbi:hypothetical protein [Candidatus Caldatribacterium sp.]|uniref:hypothetical protein n=1 Tax=Candidatus Caldatribacterium sp. TaxID=2282143 RepID=UPI00384231C0|nr:hypothetical protein [Candidatus Caldatribacterium sp.]
MDHFRVLPTDPRFRNLTQEQILLLVAMYNEDQREKARALKKAQNHQGGTDGEIVESYYDPDFDRYMEEVLGATESTGSDSEWLSL